MNSNTFQDQPGQELSYKFGSLTHPDAATPKGRATVRVLTLNDARRLDLRMELIARGEL